MLDVVSDERANLKEASSSTGEALENGVSEEEVGRLRKGGGKEGGDGSRVFHETRQCNDKTGREGDDEEGIL